MNRIIASSPWVTGLCALSLLACAGFARATEARLTLTGRVLGTRAKSIAGATVAIYTAAPRVGIGSACPSCYPECRKTAVTDAKGRFALAGLSNLLLYNLLIVGRGYVPQFVDRVDPLAAPIEPVLRVRDTVLAAGLRTLVGHVVDPQGNPVAGASVATRGIQTIATAGVDSGQTHTMFGDVARLNARIDPLAISDASGEFRLTGPDSVVAWVLHISARGSSPRVFPGAASARAPLLFKLESGATVTGTVMREGNPVPGAVIGIAQVDRDAFNSVPPDTIAADEHGQFTFANVPPSQDYAFSGIIESLAPWALRTIVRTVGEDDSVTTLPPLQLEMGHRLEGRVVLSDGKPVPPGTQLVLARELSGSFMQVPMDSTGHFELTGLPPETIQLSVRIKGYRVAPTTRGYMSSVRSGVRLPILRDYDGVEIVLEPTPPAGSAPASRP